MTIDIKKIATLTPFSALTPDNMRELSAKSQTIELTAGKTLFKQGQNDKFNYYLVNGTIELFKNNQSIQIFSEKDKDAKHPIANIKPRIGTLKTKTRCTFYQVNSDLLDVMLTWDQTGSYHVEDLEEDDGDWMTKVLQTKAFMRIPPANIQKIFMKMETVSFSIGDKIIEQGQEGDYFYIMTEGRAMVTRATPTKPNGIKLADLGAGDSFGEEALISDSKRNATVTMLAKGNLMRLSKEDFISLLAEPLIKKVSFNDSSPYFSAKNAACIDVRLPSEFRKSHIKGSHNIPLVFLRMKLKTFSKATKYLVYCDTGRRSAVAAHLMSENGFSAKVLDEGLRDVPEAILATE